MRKAAFYSVSAKNAFVCQIPIKYKVIIIKAGEMGSTSKQKVAYYIRCAPPAEYTGSCNEPFSFTINLLIWKSLTLLDLN